MHFLSPCSVQISFGSALLTVVLGPDVFHDTAGSLAQSALEANSLNRCGWWHVDSEFHGEEMVDSALDHSANPVLDL